MISKHEKICLSLLAIFLNNNSFLLFSVHKLFL